jgi:hypothetical protein
MYPRESKEDQAIERKEKEKQREEEAKKEAEAQGYPKYIADPKSVKEGYDFDGVVPGSRISELNKEKEQVEAKKEAEEEEEAHLYAEKAHDTHSQKSSIE